MTIATREPVCHAVQYTNPLAWRVASSLPANVVPPDLDFLRINLIHIRKERQEFRTEITNLAKGIPPSSAIIPCTSPTLQEVNIHLRSYPALQQRAFGFFYLAAAGGDESCVLEWTEGDTRVVALFHSIRLGIRKDVCAARRTIRHVLIACVRYDLLQRYQVCRRDLLVSLPFFATRMKDWILIFMGHFSKEWVAVFRERMRLHHHPKHARAVELVRYDSGIFCSALRALEVSDTHPYVTRYFTRLEEGGVTIIRKDPKKAFAFLYRRPIDVWQCMGWPCSPKEQAVMYKMTQDKWGLTVNEARDICLEAIM